MLGCSANLISIIAAQVYIIHMLLGRHVQQAIVMELKLSPVYTQLVDRYECSAAN
jgi:hypothetical protein